MGMKIKRVPTGIPGFDELIEGGFPDGSSTVVTGIPGCAKTTFALQYIANGALKFNDRGIFITVEKDLNSLDRTFRALGYSIKNLHKQGKLGVIDLEIKPEMGQDFLERIISDKFLAKVKEFGAKRVAIDPLNLVLQFSGDFGGERRGVQRLINAYKRIGCTLLLTYERLHQREDLEYEIADFVVDGIIYLQLIKSFGSFGEKSFFERRLSILKMRETNHAQGVYRFKIEKDGINIYSDVFLRARK